MSVIDEIKQKTDIVEVINQYTTLTKAGRTFRALCPFHSEKHASFFVYPEQQSWHCFGACGTGGDVFSFVMKQQNTDFGETLRFLAQRAGVTIPSKSDHESGKKEKKNLERLYQANEAASQYFHNLLLNSTAGEKARDYLADRGFSAKTIADFQLGFSLDSWEALKLYLMERAYTGEELLEAGLVAGTEEGKTHDRFRNRVLFPIKDTRARTIGFGARVLDDSLPKYLNSPQTPIFDKSDSLYGINLATAAIRQQNLVVIVEGYMDVITAHQNGFTNMVASMGTSITEKQVTILKRLTRNMVLALDADTAGEEAILRCVSYENTLAAEVKVVIMPRDKDPDEVIKEDSQTWQRLLEEAVPVVDYTFNMVSSKLNLTTARDKSLAVDKLLPIITEIKDIVRQAHYLQKLARLVKVNERDLEAALRRTRASQDRRLPRQVKKLGQESATHTLQPLLSSPIEEYCLTLLLQHPELKEKNGGLPPEYFENSENREIFAAWQETDDPTSLKDRLDIAIWEHLVALINKKMPADQIDQRYSDCVLRLREKFLRGLETKRETALTLEAETEGTVAELAKLKEEGIEVSIQLGEVFTQKARRGQKQRR